MNPSEYWDLSLYDEILICERVKDKFDSESRWINNLQRIVRRLFWLLFNINLKKGSPRKTEAQLWPVEGDKKNDNIDLFRKIKEKENGVRAR